MASTEIEHKIQPSEIFPLSSVPFEPKLSDNAIKVLERRYLIKGADGRVVETPAEMFRRVAINLSQAELLYGATEEQRQDISAAARSRNGLLLPGSVKVPRMARI